MDSRGSSTPRSSSRSKRSTTNLSDLRLAPLSTKFTEEQSRQHTTAESPDTIIYDPSYARHHSSYLQGRSAPSTPGILSRSSSRKQLGGGLSRRSSLYDDDVTYEYAAVSGDQTGGLRADVGSGQIPKAKSEAALAVQQRLSGQGVPLKKKQYHTRSRTGTSTPTGRARKDTDDEDWLTRASASTHALLQEAKGQSWLASRNSSTSLAHLDSDEDDVDEGYEELAASASRPSKLRIDPPSPAATRMRSPVWGSRYGSRSASRRTSRRGSMSQFQPTPLAAPGLSDVESYFGSDALGGQTEPDFLDFNPGDGADENEVARLTGERSFGLGGIVDRIMGFNLFKVDEGQETTEDEEEVEKGVESDDASRMAAELKRRREEKERLTALPPAPRDAGEEGQGGWQDAAWLLSVASKALF
ncbi:hypothetical protein B0A50_05713 [Salinomyces thailandicus]|uniref:Uncharacterized protein n=1 Tax=Salinomyces thailandicus TaxID=706561 RepID=A0A4U0TSF8_9PEZI|nr:hypothetical protein B0A50_05713 [Salinomyces thailandica]